jgi:hypothetical protein
MTELPRQSNGVDRRLGDIEHWLASKDNFADPTADTISLFRRRQGPRR